MNWLPKNRFFSNAVSHSSYPELWKGMFSCKLNLDFFSYSATVFAFGQTGSGKTFTITGPESDTRCTEFIQGVPETAGIIPRALHYLFDTVSKRPGRYSIRAAFLEIYNESVRLKLPKSSNN